MSPNKRSYALLLFSAIGIVIISLLSSHIVPLYDGVGFPDKPYRYVNPPSSAQKSSLSPSPAETVATITQGTNQADFSLASREQGPQVSFYIYQKSLITDPSIKTVGFKATPMAPDNNKPKNGQIAGNFYRFGAINPKSTIGFAPNENMAGYVDLRLPQGFSTTATVIYRSDAKSKWDKVDTKRVGNDIYEAHIRGFGDYALVPSKDAATDKPDSTFFIIYILAIIVVILSVILFALRHQHKKSKLRKKDK
jgi:hypothetical protein